MQHVDGPLSVHGEQPVLGDAQRRGGDVQHGGRHLRAVPDQRRLHRPGDVRRATNSCEETFYAVAPADFATIYNLNPLFSAGIRGAGQTIAVIEDTNIKNVATWPPSALRSACQAMPARSAR